jgi:hypothetical protein
LRVEKLVKKARKAEIPVAGQNSKRRLTKTALARELFDLAKFAEARGWSAEELLGDEIKKQEKRLRRREPVQG